MNNIGLTFFLFTWKLWTLADFPEIKGIFFFNQNIKKNCTQRGFVLEKNEFLKTDRQ